MAAGWVRRPHDAANKPGAGLTGNSSPQTQLVGAAPGVSPGENKPFLMRPTSTTWKRLGPWLFGVLALFVVILVVLRIGELTRFAELARGAEPAWLLLGLMLQALT